MTRSDQPAGLISVLLDSAAELGDRDDAAMDLAEYDDPAAEQALLQVALDASPDNELADEAGHSGRYGSAWASMTLAWWLECIPKRVSSSSNRVPAA